MGIGKEILREILNESRSPVASFCGLALRGVIKLY
ncbi:hypothetical protein LMG9964_01904 [Paraburkholderia phenoliruptrix]|uniref:Uncharacterized protein n=1 Tax=Paraburkholderia phenoliruptrix TaxID=252970 RepID=A0A6J5K3B2_9BURK|nr:hypothetical protein [Paraburkholderia phenoliruptrix]CAB4048270.1 hypothetical protein LMG9964_01904 [Paraburkholderia phenoliruptrix]